MTSIRRTSPRKGFTLVEILIVVIILGILAAIVIPQFTNASTDARKANMASQDQTVKSQISLYMLQHNDTPPALLASQSGWTQLISVTDANGVLSGVGGFLPTVSSTNPSFGPYMQAAPLNPLTNSTTVGDIASTGVAYGWFFNSVTGAFTGANSAGAQSDTGN